LPADRWSYVGAPGGERGYVFHDRSGGPIKRAVVKPGRLRVSGAGPLLTHGLAAAPEPVRVLLELGSTVYCLQFGGTTEFEPGKRFSARVAPPDVCPEE
jgi:hypothetical protein